MSESLKWKIMTNQMSTIMQRNWIDLILPLVLKYLQPGPLPLAIDRVSQLPTQYLHLKYSKPLKLIMAKQNHWFPLNVPSLWNLLLSQFSPILVHGTTIYPGAQTKNLVIIPDKSLPSLPPPTPPLPTTTPNPLSSPINFILQVISPIQPFLPILQP